MTATRIPAAKLARWIDRQARRYERMGTDAGDLIALVLAELAGDVRAVAAAADSAEPRLLPDLIVRPALARLADLADGLETPALACA